MFRILELSKDGLTGRQIAEIIGVSKTCIYSVLSGKQWSHITGFVKKFGIKRGEEICRAKLTEAEVVDIVRLFSVGNITAKRLAARYGVKAAAISSIMTGRTWSHITGIEYGKAIPKNLKGEAHYKAKITREQVLEIVRLLNAGMTPKAISRLLNVSYHSVKDISRGKAGVRLYQPSLSIIV